MINISKWKYKSGTRSGSVSGPFLGCLAHLRKRGGPDVIFLFFLQYTYMIIEKFWKSTRSPPDLQFSKHIGTNKDTDNEEKR